VPFSRWRAKIKVGADLQFVPYSQTVSARFAKPHERTRIANSRQRA